MKTRLFLSGSFTILFGIASQAQWTYLDVTEPVVQGGAANTFNAADNQPNTWGMGDDAGVEGWRFRNTGPGAPAFNTSAYTGRFVNMDPAIYSLVPGLMPNTLYNVRVYGVFPSNPTSRHGAEVSLDGGSTWSFVDNRDFGLVNWVDNSNELGAPLAGPSGGDTRFYLQAPGALLTDGSGTGRVDLRLPERLSDGQSQDRFNLDGYAFAVVPEPGTFALLGLSAAALLLFRRRS